MGRQMNVANHKKMPESTKYIGPIIEALRSLNGMAKAAAVKQWIADAMTSKGLVIPETIMASGEQKFSNDIRWARMYLVNAGILEPMATAGYGNWKLTPSGWDILLSPQKIQAIYETTAQISAAVNADAQDAPPEDPKQAELAGMGSWETVLKKTLTTMPEKGFERLCAFIMTKNGLLATKVTGQSGDGGVDGEGMLAFDDLSLIKTPVAWQCKRYEGNKVTPGHVRDFRGAIEGRAKYGLIFTTSSFTPSAEMEARRLGATPIELVGLEQFLEIMKNPKIGIHLSGDSASSAAAVQDFFAEYLHPTGSPPAEFELS
jgi:restriction system protein